MSEATIKQAEIRRLITEAKTTDWQTALYNCTKYRILRHEPVLEDPRVADWRYFLPLDRTKDVLLVGVGWGTVPIALAEVCRSVHAVDSRWERLAFLEARARQSNIDNIIPTHATRFLDMPFSDRSFDVIALKEDTVFKEESTVFYQIARCMHGLARDNGYVYLNVGNRWGFQHLRRKRRQRAKRDLYTFSGYKRLLSDLGFSQLEFYAPLPYYDGIPMFYVPLEDPKAMLFFLRNIFPLFEAVSPELKRTYAWEYAIAKAGVRLTLRLRIQSAIKFFVSGFSIIAKKEPCYPN